MYITIFASTFTTNYIRPSVCLSTCLYNIYFIIKVIIHDYYWSKHTLADGPVLVLGILKRIMSSSWKCLIRTIRFSKLHHHKSDRNLNIHHTHYTNTLPDSGNKTTSTTLDTQQTSAQTHTPFTEQDINKLTTVHTTIVTKRRTHTLPHNVTCSTAYIIVHMLPLDLDRSPLEWHPCWPPGL